MLPVTIGAEDNDSAALGDGGIGLVISEGGLSTDAISVGG